VFTSEVKIDANYSNQVACSLPRPPGSHGPCYGPPQNPNYCHWTYRYIISKPGGTKNPNWCAGEPSFPKHGNRNYLVINTPSPINPSDS
jgi:hypothetical protein